LPIEYGGKFIIQNQQHELSQVKDTTSITLGCDVNMIDSSAWHVMIESTIWTSPSTIE